MPHNMVWEEIVNRPAMVRAVASRKSTSSNEGIARNKDLAIVTIQSLLGNMLNFDEVDETLCEFYAFRRIGVLDIQPYCLGQAYICFHRALDRDIQ